MAGFSEMLLKIIGQFAISKAGLCKALRIPAVGLYVLQDVNLKVFYSYYIDIIL